MKALFCLSLTIVLFILFHSPAAGAVKFSAQSGPYSLPSTWTDNLAPQPGDDIIIRTGHRVGGAGGTVNNLTVEGTLTFSGLTVLGNLRVGPAGVMSPLHSGYQLFLKGSQIVNNGTVNSQTRINSATTQTIAGLGGWTAGGEFSGTGEKTINRMNIPLGSWAVLTVVNVNGIWRFTGGSADKQSTGTVQGPGSVVYESDGGRLSSNESTGNLWTVPIAIKANVTVPSSSSVSAPILIGPTGTIGVSQGQVFTAKSDFTVEPGGRVRGQELRLAGVNTLNNGDIQLVELSFNRMGDQAVAGGGLWKTTNSITVEGSGEKSLLNSMSINGGGLIVESALNLNNHTLTFNAGTFRKMQTGKVRGAGRLVFTGNGIFTSDDSTGNLFTAAVEINSGTRTVNATSGITAPVTIKTGATLSISINVILRARGDLTIESGAGVVGQFLDFSGPRLVNNGTIKPVETRFKSGAHVLSGNGTFGSAVEMETGSSTVLHGTQQFLTLRVLSGSSFNITNSTIKIGGTFTNAGTVTTTGSTIEYNSENADQKLVTNIDYYNLTINNPRRVFLHAPETVQNTLRLERGIFEIFTNRLTMAACAQIIHAGGVLNGTPIVSSCNDSF